MLQRGGSCGLGLSHPDSPMESWEDEGGLTALRLFQHEPWVRGGRGRWSEEGSEKKVDVEMGDKMQLRKC